MKAFCPKCGKQQECFDDISWKENVKAYKFVCDCLTATHFHFTILQERDSTQQKNDKWLEKDINTLRG